MITKQLIKLLQGYKVVKTLTNDGPLPQMIQYQLHSDNGQRLSFWNDIPFNLKNDIVNCVVQVPKQKHGKFQVKKSVPFHPIMQDTRKNIFSQKLQLRFYNQFPLFNYGYIPQTWEQNIVKDQHGLLGDDDPIDICDLSSRTKECGQVFRGKVLGSFCLIDQGEIDWKVFVIDQQESREFNIHKIEDFDPRKMESIKSWFKIVKVPDGKKPNTIAYNEKIFNKQQTLKVLAETRKSWVDLMKNDLEAISRIRTKYLIKKRTDNIQN